jgi:hypothetical protein
MSNICHEAKLSMEKVQVELCNELRWVVKASCFLYEQVDLKVQIRNLVKTILAEIKESSYQTL